MINKVIGVVTWQVLRNDKTIFICELYVHKLYRDRGVARQLFDNVSVPVGYKMQLHCHISNPTGMEFWSKLGFEMSTPAPIWTRKANV